MIAARCLTKKFGQTTAVDSVDFDIPAGQVVGFLGPNGAGKTTTMRMICGYLHPTAGHVTVGGLDVTRHSLEIRSQIGYLPESAPSYGEMRVAEYLKFRAGLFGLSRSDRRRAIAFVLKRCWLEDVRRRPIHQLSKGYRQRVGLAAALLHSPPVLILDEPTAGLDPSQIQEVRGLIAELAGEHTILLSTHILPEVELTCSRIIMLADGKIRAAGSIDELRAQAAGQAKYIVETKAASAQSALSGISAVATVESKMLDDGWHRLTIVARANSSDLRETIADVIAKCGGTAREIRRKTPSLEQLFMRMMAQPDRADSATPTGDRS